MARLSVVIPALNDAEMLERCLTRLSEQTRQADEIIVVDNGSTDNTAAVARYFGARVVFEPVRGIPSATAAGLDAARGDICARLDADSVPAHDWLERIEKHFAEDPRLTAVTGSGDFYGSKAWVHWAGRRLYLGGYFWFFEWLLGHPPIFGSNCAIQTEAWHRIRDHFHRTEQRIHDDLDLSFQIQPDMTVKYDRDLTVGVSSRPLTSARRLTRGVWWGWTTVDANRQIEPVFERRSRRRLHEKRELAS